MKTMKLFLGTIVAALILGCEGEEGPPGLDGIDGAPGIQAQVFDVDNVDFFYDQEANLHIVELVLADFTSFEVLSQDAILVYRLEDVVEFEDGTLEDAWSLLPQNFFLPEGTIQYVYNHTTVDVQILIDGNFDLSNLDPVFTTDQIFRIAILPGEEAAKSNVDERNMASVLNAVGIEENDVPKYVLP